MTVSSVPECNTRHQNVIPGALWMGDVALLQDDHGAPYTSVQKMHSHCHPCRRPPPTLLNWAFLQYHQACSATKCNSLLVETAIFCQYRSLILCNSKHLQFNLIKKTRTQGPSSASLLFPYAVPFLSWCICCFRQRCTKISSLRRLHFHF